VTGEAGGGRAYLEIPPQLNLGEWVVDRHVREGRGGQPAVHAGDRIYSYADLRRLSNRVANALGGLGIGRGDRVLLRQGTNLDCPGLALGYYRDPERWAGVNRGGWYYTKDFASVDEDGYYWYVSRSDDLIKSRGYMISPREVESALMEHAAVLEAGVVGVSDPVIGQKVRAYVTLKPGVAASPDLAEGLKAHTRRVIAPFKTPQEVSFVPELPKTLTGKVLRRELRAQG